MSNEFFSLFPKVTAYVPNTELSATFTDKTIPLAIETTDLLVKHAIKEAVLNQSTQFYPYVWKDEDRPDTVAHKYYGNSKYFWIVFYSNEAFDLVYDFPMPAETFKEFLYMKYRQILIDLGSITEATPEATARQAVTTYLNTGVHHYEIDIEGVTYTVDSDYVNALPVTFYEYEHETNEAKRRVNLINSDLLFQVVAEFKDNMNAIAAQRDALNG